MKSKKLFWTSLFLAVVSWCALAGSSWAAGYIFVSMEGTQQGSISQGAGTVESIGPNAVNGFEDMIYCTGTEHSVQIPTDPLSGQITGQRVYAPFTLIKFVDKASPKIYQALSTGESLPQVVFRFYRIGRSGSLEHYFTVQLEDAMVTNITSIASGDGSLGREKISLSFRRIIWTHETTGTQSQDDWRTPRT